MTIYLGIAILLSLIYIGVELFYKPLFSFLFKAFASMSFVVLGILALSFNLYQSYIYLLIGLLFGFIGDLVLALRPLRPKEENEKIINLGILAFSLGHLSYLFFIFSGSQIKFISIVLGLLMTLFVIFGSYLMKFKMGRNRIPSYIYSALIFLMIGQMFVFHIDHISNQGLLLMFIGAILFGISDLILAPIYFKEMNTKVMIGLNLVTYYAAQILIAYSIFFI